jgi:hypothetical protein
MRSTNLDNRQQPAEPIIVLVRDQTGNQRIQKTFYRHPALVATVAGGCATICLHPALLAETRTERPEASHV